jgi:ATP-dependent DNA helicase RecG
LEPLIASVFYKRGIIETWGQGTIRMASWAQAAGLPAPEILEIPGAVVVRFRRAMTGETPEKTEALVKTPVKTPEDELAPGKAPGKTQVAVLELLREGPYLTVAEMATRLDRSESAINRAIRQLRESGRLERVGPDKGGSWKVLR